MLYHRKRDVEVRGKYLHLDEIGYEHGPSPSKLVREVNIGKESANSSEGVHSLFVSLFQVNDRSLKQVIGGSQFVVLKER